jgi:xanthine dehydrogenase accessory factor
MFDRAELQAALAAQGTVVRVVIAEVKGSSPREVGAAMLVWRGGQAGTIGGGALEHLATGIAGEILAGAGARRFGRWPLGPAIGQCCGGAVALLFERFTPGDVDALPDGVFARPAATDSAMPLAVKRLLAAQRGSGVTPAPQLVQGWFVEPVAVLARPLWIWGAGHVGRALVSVLAPLPDLAITWVDTAPERFPATIPEGVTAVPVADPALLVAHAPRDAAHLVLTYSHALDLELCHRILAHGFASLGVIGSATKAARFRARLHDLGHLHTEIQRIACPIGDKSLGKHPQAIAIGMASALLKGAGEQGKRRGMAG